MDEPDAYKQGPHPDPLDPAMSPPDPAALPKRWREALTSPEMAAYRAGLMLPGCPDVRDSILNDLNTYYGFDPAECVRRCINWEQWSVQEWQARPRSSPEGIADFYNMVQSWSFDLLWYAYLQAEGWSYPAPVVAARMLPRPPHAVRCLDFGSGVGDTAQLLLTLGYQVELADVSQTLLAFARYRLERRQQQASYIDLTTTALGADQYDIIIVRDVLTQVPDFPETVTKLHSALRPGGLLFANFDVRPPSPENAWHLYSDDVPLRRVLQNVGFEQLDSIDHALFKYKQVEPSGLSHLLRRTRNAVVLCPLRHAYRHGKFLARDFIDLATRTASRPRLILQIHRRRDA